MPGACHTPAIHTCLGTADLFGFMQAQAPEAVLRTGSDEHEPRDLSFSHVADALTGREKRRTLDRGCTHTRGWAIIVW